MKGFFVVCLLISVASAAPTNNNIDETINYVNNNNGLGTYSYSYETSNGIQVQQQAVPEDPKDPDSPLIVTGFYTYIGDDNVVYKVEYIADRNGYNIVKDAPVGQKRFG